MGVWGETIFGGFRIRGGQPVSIGRPLLARPFALDPSLVHQPPQCADYGSLGDLTLGLLNEGVLGYGVLLLARQGTLYELHGLGESDLFVRAKGHVALLG